MVHVDSTSALKWTYEVSTRRKRPMDLLNGGRYGEKWRTSTVTNGMIYESNSMTQILSSFNHKPRTRHNRICSIALTQFASIPVAQLQPPASLNWSFGTILLAMLVGPLPASYSDLPELVSVFGAAFAADPILSLARPTMPPDISAAHALKDHQADWVKPGRRLFKMVDSETGGIAACSKWIFPHANPEKWVVKESWPEQTNEELMTEFYTKLYGGRNRWVDMSDDYLMAILAVRPGYQRQGLGARLLQPTLDLADSEGRKTYIEASAMGLGLYIKHGWVEIDSMDIDMRRHGGEAIVRMWFQMRHPKAGVDRVGHGTARRLYNDIQPVS